jgi:hypothetical protein
MTDSKTLFCSSKFPWVRERISSKCIDNLGTCSQKTGSPPFLRYCPVDKNALNGYRDKLASRRSWLALFKNIFLYLLKIPCYLLLGSE